MHPLIFVALICAVAASPAFESNQRYCKVVTKLVTFAKAQQAATAYCSSYLSIPPATPTTTSIVTVFQVCQRSATPVNEGRDLVPRAADRRPITKPGRFGAYINNKQISSACRCLSITPATPPTPTTTVAIAVRPSDGFYLRAEGGPSDGNFIGIDSDFKLNFDVETEPTNAIGRFFIIEQNILGRVEVDRLQRAYQDIQGSGFTVLVKGDPTNDDYRDGPVRCEFVLRGDGQTCSIGCRTEEFSPEPPYDVSRIRSNGTWELATDGVLTNAFTPVVIPFVRRTL